jgi:2-hydroxychromene-2-carboxylate isomerase
MNREVEFLFDYGSPFSYLANPQIEGSPNLTTRQLPTPLFCSALQ